jgi:hypothetical protein
MREENLIQVKEELSNRITAFMSALGQKRTFRSAIDDVRFTRESGHRNQARTSPSTHQLWQLGDVRRDPARLVPRRKPGR